MDDYQHLRESADADADVSASSAIRTIARMVVDRREQSLVAATRARRIAQSQGYEYSLNAEQAEGAHAAYSIVASIIAGACGVASIDVLTAEDPEPVPDLFDPDLPVTDVDAFFRPVSQRG